VDDLPLLELFTQLRESGMSLGIQDYETVLHALQAGHGLAAQGATPVEHYAALARLCRTLWVRSPEEQQLLDYHLAQLLGSRPQLPKPHPKSSFTRIRPILVSLASVLLIGAGSVSLWWMVQWYQRKIEPIQRPSPSPSLNAPNQVPPATSAGGKFGSQSQPQDGSNSATQTGQTGARVPSSSSSAPSIPPHSPMPVHWVFWSVPLILILAVFSWWWIRRWLKQPPPNASELPPEANPNLASELLRQTKDEIQVAQAVRQLRRQDELPRKRFVLSADYLPVTQRQMKQSWRHLRQMVREGMATELDMEGTVRRIARDGILLHPVMRPPRMNRTELVLLLDQDGSMVPFHALSLRLAETAQRGGRLGQSGIFYFHNCPVDYLYHDAWHQTAEPLLDVLAKFRRDRTVVLIFSDAGAARGGMNVKRVALTIAFLKRLKRYSRHVAWLNPMPKPRWTGTTADEIARYVPMFEGTRQGLDQAIEALRGRYTVHFISRSQVVSAKDWVQGDEL
jgi:hypothetical protein